VGNSSAGHGGGIYNHDSHDNTLTLTNATVAGNSSSGLGGGIYSYDYDTLTVNNSIVARNDAAGDDNIFGSWSGSNNLVDVDPLFVRNPSAGIDGVWGTADDDHGDLHLQAGSIAINRGDNALAVDSAGTPLATDIEGNARIVESTVDVGAYEYQQTVSGIQEAPSATVTILADVVDTMDGQISLREALVYAGDLAATTIMFDSSLSNGTIVLDGEQLRLDRSVTIDATAVGDVTIDADGQSRVAYVATGTTVALKSLTLIGGHTIGDGGGIYNSSDTLTVIDSMIADNSAGSGGGLSSRNGTVVLKDSVIARNLVGDDGEGGGIAIDTGTLDMEGCTVADNTVGDEGSGGGVHNQRGTATIVDSEILRNEVLSGFYSGGGLHNERTMTVVDSLVAGNAGAGGGGIFNGLPFNAGSLAPTPSLDVVNSVIVGNVSRAVGRFEQWGITAGGIANRDGNLTLANSTIAANSVQAISGWFPGISTYASADPFWPPEYGTTISNSVVSLNTFNGESVPQINSTVTTINSSLIADDPLFVRNPSAGADGVWGTADDDYGDLRLTAASPALDAGDDTLLPVDEFDLDGDGDTAEPLPLDLAGNARIAGPAVDIGAYELAYIPGDANLDQKIDLSDLIAIGQNYGSPGAWATGDFNGDGTVDLSDLIMLGQHYGEDHSAASTPAVQTTDATPLVSETATATSLPGVETLDTTTDSVSAASLPSVTTTTSDDTTPTTSTASASAAAGIVPVDLRLPTWPTLTAPSIDTVEFVGPMWTPGLTRAQPTADTSDTLFAGLANDLLGDSL
jgi:hypothetical protein